MSKWLKGSFDMHIHTSPDVVVRRENDIDLAKRLIKAGMKGCVIKCHYTDTSSRALLLERQFPQLRIGSGVTLNRSVGGINPYAVEYCHRMGGRFVWFPTLDARSYQKYQHRNEANTDVSEFLSVVDEEGNLIPNAIKILELAAKYKMIVGTGHLGADEGMELVKEAAKKGCQMVLTHADNPADCYTIKQQVEAVRLGAIVEHCFFTTYYNRVSIEEIARQIRAVGCENIILATDFGQMKSPYSDEGMEQYAQLLNKQGFSEEEIKIMSCQNAKNLLDC